VLGVIFDIYGWVACVAGIGMPLAVAAVLAVALKTPLEAR
jgi:YNFM family putative membrane transporter